MKVLLWIVSQGVTIGARIVYASAQLRPGVAAFGEGETREAAIADLRSGLELLIEEVGIPDELTLTLNVA